MIWFGRNWSVTKKIDLYMAEAFVYFVFVYFVFVYVVFVYVVFVYVVFVYLCICVFCTCVCCILYFCILYLSVYLWRNESWPVPTWPARAQLRRAEPLAGLEKSPRKLLRRRSPRLQPLRLVSHLKGPLRAHSLTLAWTPNHSPITEWTLTHLLSFRLPLPFLPYFVEAPFHLGSIFMSAHQRSLLRARLDCAFNQAVRLLICEQLSFEPLPRVFPTC